ncbi:alpha/beta hydrolase-fold protein [Actinomycetospora sp. OC33-EN08]|uniref:Alpha/beta hydrolase-fold protein n=1 Tax=Actinomycetospora aurantiaca TaxID=3129233 RepID=A0ABU8MSW0_9PSEU
MTRAPERHHRAVPRRRPLLRRAAWGLAALAAVLVVVIAVEAGGDPGDTAITDVPFGALLVVLLLLAVLGVVLARRPVRRALAVVGLVVALLLTAAAALNLHFEYYLTLGQAVGQDPSDEETIDELLSRDSDPGPGVVAPVTVPARVSGFAARPAMVYVPPAFFARPRPALPVVVLLHGTPGTPQDWIDGGLAAQTADTFAAAHGGRAPILVMPDVNGSTDADSECVDGPVGRVETYLTQDVPAYVTATFATRPTGAGWAVAGLSEGGSCAIVLALRHPTLFHTFGDFSGLAGPRAGDTNADTASAVTQLFGGSQAAFAAHEPATILASKRFGQLGGWFQVGDADPEPAAAQAALVPEARRAGIAVCSVVVPGGGHTFDVFSAAFADSLPWMAARLGIPTPGAACPQQ